MSQEKPVFTGINSVLHETRTFPPAKAFSQKARIKALRDYEVLYERAQNESESFWSEVARKLTWSKEFTKILSWNPPYAKWFEDGRLNASANCLDRHLESSRRDKTALIWVGEPGEVRRLTFAQLTKEVAIFAGALQTLGLKLGDRVTIYMPMIPELIIAVLACARLGLTHNVVFGGFSSKALADRIHDSSSKVVITADAGYRRGKLVELKKEVDQACEKAPFVEKVIVYERAKNSVTWKKDRDISWSEFVSKAKPAAPVAVPAEHPLFILYTSGTTGKPKGIIHSTGGYLTQVAYSAELVFDLQEDDIYWCTADIGWVTGHSYVIYGPLANGTTVLIYEGAPNFPDPGRFWEIIDQHKVTKFYTAPTAIRAFMKWGDSFVKKYELSSLKLLGTVGEPINPEAWIWYHELIGKGRCPIVDTWWQTETGAIMIAPLPGATPTKPGSATLPLPGVSAEILDEAGKKVSRGQGGMLVLTKPWPSMLRGIHGDPERFKKQYWDKYPGNYFTGDGARCDEDGYFWIMGRVDDVIKVAGHRLGTMEIESALVSYPSVAEAAVVSKPDPERGNAIVAFVILRENAKASKDLEAKLIAHVGKEIGHIAKPESIHFIDALPKTRSGKIMRRLLQEIAEKGTATGDQTTLEDAAVLKHLQKEGDE